MSVSVCLFLAAEPFRAWFIDSTHLVCVFFRERHFASFVAQHFARIFPDLTLSKFSLKPLSQLPVTKPLNARHSNYILTDWWSRLPKLVINNNYNNINTTVLPVLIIFKQTSIIIYKLLNITGLGKRDHQSVKI